MLAEQAARLGKTVAYPVCGENFTLTAAVPGPDGWEVGAYGIRTPVLERAALVRPEALDLVLVPCTAFDAVCRRVGMGKGYYDRYLPRCRNAVALGVAFEAQRVPEAAADEQDRRLDGFVTERKVYRGTVKVFWRSWPARRRLRAAAALRRWWARPVWRWAAWWAA